MIHKFSIFVTLLAIGGIFLILSLQSGASQTTEEENANEVISEATGNNTIVLDVAEVGEE